MTHRIHEKIAYTDFHEHELGETEFTRDTMGPSSWSVVT